MILPENSLVASHQIVSDACRSGRGDEGAGDEAVRRLVEEYRACLKGWGQTPGTRFHFVLAVEPPAKDAPWTLPNEYGEHPGDLCCQRSGGRCWEHNPANFKDWTPS